MDTQSQHGDSSILRTHIHFLDRFILDTVSSPEAFVVASPKLYRQALHATKILFDHANKESLNYFGLVGPFQELIVDGFDTEQIWQELNIHNQLLCSYLEDIQIPKLFHPSEEVNLELDFGLVSDRGSEQEDDHPSFDDQDSLGSDSIQPIAGDESIPDELEDLDGDVEDSSDDKGDRSESRQKDEMRVKEGPLDDGFFNWNDMVQFADEGEDGKSGLLIGDASEDEHIYDVMYGEAELPESDEESNSIADESQMGCFGKFIGQMDETDKRLEEAFELTCRSLLKEGGNSANDDSSEMADSDSGIDSKKERDNSTESSLDSDNDDSDNQMTAFEMSEKTMKDKIKELEEDNILLDNEEALNLEEDKDLPVTRFALEQKRMRDKVTRLEKNALSKKPWQEMGEASAKQRPVNSLLEEFLDFEHATKIAPIITSDVTSAMEEMIKSRIRDGAFDDVVRIIDKPDKGDWRPRSAVLDQEKSAKSLSQIYEDEYVRQTRSVQDTDEVIREHQECSKLFLNICFKLDALANANYTPIKLCEEAEVKPLPDAPAIQLEEVTPAAVSTATRLAPEEVYEANNQGMPRGESEWTSEERKKSRREHKRSDMKKRHLEELEKRRQDILHPKKVFKLDTVAGALENIKKAGKVVQIDQNTDAAQYHSSTAVFKKIQDDRDCTDNTTAIRLPVSNRKSVVKTHSSIQTKL